MSNEAAWARRLEIARAQAIKQSQYQTKAQELKARREAEKAEFRAQGKLR